MGCLYLCGCCTGIPGNSVILYNDIFGSKRLILFLFYHITNRNILKRICGFSIKYIPLTILLGDKEKLTAFYLKPCRQFVDCTDNYPYYKSRNRKIYPHRGKINTFCKEIISAKIQKGKYYKYIHKTVILSF